MWLSLQPAVPRTQSEASGVRACGKLISKIDPGRKRRPVCSFRCRSFLNYGRWPEEGKELVGPVPRTIFDTPDWRLRHVRNEVPSSKGTFVSGPCEQCGTQYVGWGTSPRQVPKTCSKRCAKRRQRSLRSSRFVVTEVRRQRLYERDNWTCQLCMEPIDRDAHYLDDWAPSWITSFPSRTR